MRARVGAMPLPPKASSQHDQQSQVQGSNRIRVHSGMSLEELKRETAFRLGHADASVDGSSEPNFVAGIGVRGGGGALALQHPTQNNNVGANTTMMLSPSQSRMQYPQQDRECSPSFVYPNHYVESRNYTDTQLGVGGGTRAGHDGINNEIPIFSQPAGFIPTLPQVQQQQQQQQQYSTPRLPRRATVLKDRGSAENSVGSSDPPVGIENMESTNNGSKGKSSGGCYTKISPSSLSRGNRGASQSSNKNSSAPAAAAMSQPPKDMRSHEGRRTPVRDQMEGQVLFATPNHGRDAVPSTTPTSVYSEPPPRNKTFWNRPSSTMSPNFHQLRSPDHHAGGGGGGGGGGGYSKCGVTYGKGQVSKQHQSKLPHGLTVQELKEMTRARLAAEAEIGGPDGSSDQSDHSAEGGYYASANETMARQQVHSNEPIRMEFYNQGAGSWISQGRQQPPPQMQPQNMSPYQYPRHPSPGFGAGPYHFNGNMPPQAPSPAFGSSASQDRGQGETWDTSSAASDYSLHATYSSSRGDANIMQGNRGRCFSAGATTGIPYSSQKNQSAYYGNVPSMGAVNRQDCSSMTPPGMSRLHEDRPLFFSHEEKSKLAIPPLSQPRTRVHSVGGLNIHQNATPACSSGLPSMPTSDSLAGNAFAPISKMTDQSWSQLMNARICDRFSSEDSRTFLTGRTASGNGDLPSSMAEAVLASITSNASGAPMVGQAISPPRFRTMSNHELVGESSMQRVSSKSMASGSVFRVDDTILRSDESRNIFSPKTLSETHSWGGGSEDGTTHSTLGLNHDFSNLWNVPDDNGTALRGRAATEPVWFGANDSLLVSRIDPEVEASTFVNMNPQNQQSGF